MFSTMHACDLNLEFWRHLFPTNVVDDLASLVLGSGFPTKWFGLSYDIKHVLCHFSYFVHDLHMPRLSTTNENSYTCVTLSLDSKYVIFI